MFSSKSKIKGRISAVVLTETGEIKRFEPNFIQRLFGLQGRRMYVTNHNIVTNEGDALVADLLANTPARTKIDNSNGFIEVGSGFSSEAKTVESCVASIDTEGMQATYPKVKGSFGDTDDNVVQYRAVFSGLDNSGIDEVALLNNSTPGSADCMAYAEIDPAVNVGSSDTLQIDWELTVTGS